MAPTMLAPWEENSYILSFSGRPAFPSAAENSNGEAISRVLPLMELPAIERGVSA